MLAKEYFLKDLSGLDSIDILHLKLIEINIMFLLESFLNINKLSNNYLSIFNLNDRFVYELCKANTSLPEYGSEKYFILLSKFEAYKKLTANSSIKEDIVNVLESLNNETKINNYFIPLF
uniref:Uncharacterized protein n=1 Tax=Amanita phalloides TaxID=67723 RepID=A0A5Q0N2V5_AMAPH|nr:hypothetical protein [Amanita phalloides]QFZ98671.1 hypothetical protein [Amanita phalloides]WLF85176.1 hypothetical protein [Amanita phalloides]